MNSYKISIPQDVAQLFFSVLKKSRVLSNLLVTPTDVRVVSDFEVPNYGALCYTHSTPIRERATYRFSVDPSVNVTSDLILEWDVESPNDENSPHFVKNARFLFQGFQVPIITATTLPDDSRLYFEHCVVDWKPLPTELTSSIPQLSKYITEGRYGHSVIFPGIVFTKQSAFATTGSQFAGWTDSVSPHAQCTITSDIVDTFIRMADRFNTDSAGAFTTLYNKITENPEAYWETLDFFSDDYMYRSVVEYAQIFKNVFPDAEAFIDSVGNKITHMPTAVPVAFPKYLEKMLVQDTCSYGFTIRYEETCLQSPDEIQTPCDILFFISSQTYGGKRLDGRLIWHTPVNVNHATQVKALDAKMFGFLAELDESYKCTMPVSVFQSLQKRVKGVKKLSPTDVPNVAFINHDGKLGIGRLVDDEITSTATTVSCPAGLKEYIIIPAEISTIPIPFNAQTVTLVFKEDDVTVPVYVMLGNLVYCFARIDSFDGGVRLKKQVSKTTEVIAAPSMPKFGITSAPVVVPRR